MVDAAALVVFVATYAALTVPALPRLARQALPPSERLVRLTNVLLDRPAIAVAGGLGMVVVGVVGWRDAVESVDVGILVLLVGMMVLVAGLEAANFFAVAAAWLVRSFPSPRALFAATCAMTAVMSAIALNDAVVLLFTPVLVKAARAARLNPLPFLVGEAVSANVGSVATPVGNPQNAFIAIASGLSFVEFARALAPVAAASLLVAIGLGLVFFRRELAARPAEPAHVDAAISNARMMRLTAGAIAGLLLLFALGGAVPLNLWQKAALAGGVVLALAWPVARVSPARLLASVDWSILAFFVGLFVLIRGVRDGGLMAALYGALAAVDPSTVPGLTVLSAVLSNLVSNVPAVLLLADAARGSDALWLALAASSTLAGNATILGAAANVIVAQSARAFGADLDAWTFLKFGLPLTIATLGIAAWAVG